jgi:hypothetical protein
MQFETRRRPSSAATQTALRVASHSIRKITRLATMRRPSMRDFLCRKAAARQGPQRVETTHSSLAGNIPPMAFVAVCFVAAIVGTCSIYVLFARIGRLPARSLANNSGHVMVHAHLDKGIAWTFATLVVLAFTSGIYRAWQIESWGLATFVAVFAALFGWVAFIYLRKQRNTIELTDSAITWRRGSLVTVILWSEVVGFTDAPSSTAWLVRARDGRTLRVDKLLVGVPTTFVDYLRKYLSPQLFDTALAYVRPKAALRALIRRRSGLN